MRVPLDLNLAPIAAAIVGAATFLAIVYGAGFLLASIAASQPHEDLGILAAPSGKAVLICGESFTVNEDGTRTNEELRVDFETLMAQRPRCDALRR